MSKSSRLSLFWAPRILTIAFALFVSAFALDVIGEGYTGWELLLALLIHLIPTAILAVVLTLAWRWEWVGAVLFAGLGTVYLLLNPRHINWIFTISGPLFLIAALFLINWLKRAELHPGAQSR